MRHPVPETVVNINGTTIIWDLQVVTGRKVLASRPNIELHDKKEKTCLLIDMAIPDDSNINIKKRKI